MGYPAYALDVYNLYLATGKLYEEILKDLEALEVYSEEDRLWKESMIDATKYLIAC